MSTKLVCYKVYANSPAEKAGITMGYTVVSYDGVTVTSSRELDNAIELASKSGKSTVPVYLVDNGGRSIRTEVAAGPLGILCVERSDVANSAVNRQSEYPIARGVASFISFIGGLAVLGGIIAVISVFVSSKNTYGFSFLALLPAIGTIVTGLLMVAGAQITRAAVDTADYAREIRDLLKRT